MIRCSCGREWPDAETMRAETKPIGIQRCGGFVLELANCTCGSTRCVTAEEDTEDGPDVAPEDDCPPTLRCPGVPGLENSCNY